MQSVAKGVYLNDTLLTEISSELFYSLSIILFFWFLTGKRNPPSSQSLLVQKPIEEFFYFLCIRTDFKWVSVYEQTKIRRYTCTLFIQVFAIELVTFAVDFVLLAVEFGAFAVEFVALALQFVALAIELDAFAMGLGAFALELVAFALEFVMAIMTQKN